MDNLPEESDGLNMFHLSICWVDIHCC